MSLLCPILLPLMGFLFAGLTCRFIKPKIAEMVTTILVIISAIMSGNLLLEVFQTKSVTIYELFDWINLGDFRVTWSVRLDMLSASMIFTVNFVSALVHLYSIGYMHDDQSRSRFMSYLSLFTFCMLSLVSANNFMQLFFGWEGVGLSSYLLIGFWYFKDSARQAAIKAFLVNRVADIGLILALCLIYNYTGSLDFDVVFSQVSKINGQFNIMGFDVETINLVCFLLMIGAFGKSAQIGLHVWLPDAMEGPTPVSALIHAATMVTAGIFLIVRASPLFELSSSILGIILLIGAITSLFAGLIATVQTDIKKIIAYSTCSQLGYMFMACGVSAYSASMFHLLTHAFFKALLFLSAGSVIHAVSNEQNIFKMGNLARKLPFTHLMMWVGSLALAGIFPFAGYYSKDLILEAIYFSPNNFGKCAYFIGVFGAFLTAFYSFRLIFKVFHGKANYNPKIEKSIHESPLTMSIPLACLALFALTSGYFGNWLNIKDIAFWGETIKILPINDSLSMINHEIWWVAKLPLFASIFGIILSYVTYIKLDNMAYNFAKIFSVIRNVLIHKFYFDELYEFIFIRLYKVIANLGYQMIEKLLINNFVIGGMVRVVLFFSRMTKNIQTGFIFNYLTLFVLIIVVILSYYNFMLNWK